MIMGLSSITELADTIRENSKTLSDYLVLSGCPAPSLDFDGAPVSIEHGERKYFKRKGNAVECHARATEFDTRTFGEYFMNIAVGGFYNSFGPNAL